MKLLEFLGFCSHTWVVVEKGTIVTEYRKACGNWYISQCKKCGKIKRNNFTT